MYVFIYFFTYSWIYHTSKHVQKVKKTRFNVEPFIQNEFPYGKIWQNTGCREKPRI